MSDLKHARMMLDLAYDDFRAAHAMTDEEVFTDAIFGFHVQQAAEKALKSWLSLIGVEYPKTHDLRVLFALLKNGGEEIPEEFLRLIDLSSFAVQSRYVSFESSPEEVDRTGLIEQVAELLEYVEKRFLDMEASV